jgi:membrane fusion protein (multidrug efflux system)
MFRERGNAVVADDAVEELSAPQDIARLSRKAQRRTALKTVEETRSRPSPSPGPSEPPAAPPAEEPAATPDIRTETAKPADAELAPAPARRSLRRLVLVFGVVAALAAGLWYGDYWWTVGRFYVSTDDAYVGAKSATIAAKVSGYVRAVAVDDNQHVKVGETIATVDDGDYQLAAQTAKDQIATEQATIERIGKQIESQLAAIGQAKAQLAAAKAGQTRAELELDRQQALAAKDFASHQALERAQADRDQQIASVQGAEAAVAAAEANQDVLKAQQEEAKQTLKQLQTALAKAMRDLSFTVIKAPYDGVVGNRAVETGDYVEPGQRLATLVPLGAVYIDANFKETQLVKLKAGQIADISVDALPSRSIEGKVVSVAPASGSVFSLLPPDNATGNFTKIVQRVPVRIEVPDAVAGQELLRPGMSVVVSINTKADAPTQSAAR